MLTIKNRGGPKGDGCLSGFLLAILSGLLLTACTPPGPKALLTGKKLLEKRKLPAAVEELKQATVLMPTNAHAWNYLGLAYHQTGQAVEAERAYQRALKLDNDLSEARFNLGCLWLEQNKPDWAKAELTAFTLRRGSSPEGFVKLGTAQLRLRDWAGAEKSFADASRLAPKDPEPLTGLGIARLQKGRPADASQCFNAALKVKPGYRPALLNLAVLSHQTWKDKPAALKHYRAYLAAGPTPENAVQVNAAIQKLETDIAAASAATRVRPPAVATLAQAATNTLTRTNPPQAKSSVPTEASTLASHPPKPPVTTTTNVPTVTAPVRPFSNQVATAPSRLPINSSTTREPTQVVAVASAPRSPVVKTAPVAPPPPATDNYSLSEEPEVRPGGDPSRVVPEPLEKKEVAIETKRVPAVPQSTNTAKPKRSVFQRIFGGTSRSSGTSAGAETTTQSVSAAPSSSTPAETPGNTVGYRYRNIGRLLPGNRREAEVAFTQAFRAQQASRTAEALRGYRRATELDPTYFEAYYNLGLTATADGDVKAAMEAYEHALAVSPQSLDARYNFALLLRQFYVEDAVQQLQQILKSHPNEGRVHLALGNIYAQQLDDAVRARHHYVKMLEVDPKNSQAAEVRYWLAANPQP